MTYLLFALEVIALTCILFVTALGIWKAMGWFIATLPEDEMDKPTRLEDVTLVEDGLPKALHRLAAMNFRKMPCGHNPYSWNAVRGECEQCVLEGRSAKRDMGKLRP